MNKANGIVDTRAPFNEWALHDVNVMHSSQWASFVILVQCGLCALQYKTTYPRKVIIIINNILLWSKGPGLTPGFTPPEGPGWRLSPVREKEDTEGRRGRKGEIGGGRKEIESGRRERERERERESETLTLHFNAWPIRWLSLDARNTVFARPTIHPIHVRCRYKLVTHTIVWMIAIWIRPAGSLELVAIAGILGGVSCSSEVGLLKHGLLVGGRDRCWAHWDRFWCQLEWVHGDRVDGEGVHLTSHVWGGGWSWVSSSSSTSSLASTPSSSSLEEVEATSVVATTTTSSSSSPIVTSPRATKFWRQLIYMYMYVLRKKIHSTQLHMGNTLMLQCHTGCNYMYIHVSGVHTLPIYFYILVQGIVGRAWVSWEHTCSIAAIM